MSPSFEKKEKRRGNPQNVREALSRETMEKYTKFLLAEKKRKCSPWFSPTKKKEEKSAGCTDPAFLTSIYTYRRIPPGRAEG